MEIPSSKTQLHASLDFGGFAQEFLRRNREYRDEYRAHAASREAGQADRWAQRWGLAFRI